MYEDEDTSWSFGIGLFVGAVVGAAVASVLTPRSGQQNREAVLEKGIVLKDRVSGATSNASSSVKGTTSTAVSSVKDATNSAVTKVSDTVTAVKEKASVAVETVTEATSTVVHRVSETASNTVERLQDAASTAAEKVSDAASTATERVSSVASTAAEKVSDVASTATERVSSVASTAAEKVSDVASTATDKAREITQRTQSSDTTSTPAVPSTEALISEANYDAEDVRPATAGSVRGVMATPSTGTISSTSTKPLDVLHSIDTFEPTMADVTAATTIEEGISASSDVSTADVFNAQFEASPVVEAQTELRSDEQFEVTDTSVNQERERGVGGTTVAGTNADVREASEGADRSV